MVNTSFRGDFTDVTCTRYILQKKFYEKKKIDRTENPVEGIGFSLFEEDVAHHIHEAFAMISSGAMLSFYADLFVQRLARILS